MDYDVIGDVHGHASALAGLLEKLGYREREGAYRHPSRMALFVGDFIDRGPEQVRTVTLVRRMVEAGSARAVMGNHELNAIAWFLEDPDAPGLHLRRHARGNNRAQHAAFLAEVEAKPALHAELVDWFLTLPLWLDLPEVRVVHACWHERFMEFLAPRLRPGHRLDRGLMVPATREPADDAEKDTPEPTIFKAVEALTKGIEIPMPPGRTFRDKDGHVRARVRVRWWDREATTYRDAAMLPLEERTELPRAQIAAHARIGYAGAKPVFFGHYWLTGTPAPLGPSAACLDYSIGKAPEVPGRLCAYRYDGEPALDEARFVSVGPGGTP